MRIAHKTLKEDLIQYAMMPMSNIVSVPPEFFDQNMVVSLFLCTSWICTLTVLGIVCAGILATVVVFTRLPRVLIQKKITKIEHEIQDKRCKERRRRELKDIVIDKIEVRLF